MPRIISMSKIVLITGASSGIGKSTAELLTKRGFTVYGTSRKPKQAEIDGYRMVALDVTDEGSIKKAVGDIIQKEGRLDVLVNNAGMGITGPVEDTPTDEMRKVFDTNFFGAIDVMKAVIPQKMRKQRSGSIINVTSYCWLYGIALQRYLFCNKRSSGIDGGSH